MSREKTNIESFMEIDLDDLFGEYGYKEDEIKEVKKVPEKKAKSPLRKIPKRKEGKPSEIAGEMALNYYNRAEFWRDRYAFFVGKPWRADAETLYLNFIPIVQMVQEIFGNLTKNQREDREFTLSLIKQIKERVTI